MSQQTFDNLDTLAAVRTVLNANAADALSKGETSDQAMASNVDFASGKGVQFDGGDVNKSYEENEVTITLTPQTTGTIALNNDVLAYTRNGREVSITGSINVASVSSPVGLEYIVLGSLPFSIATLTKRAGRVGFSVTTLDGATPGAIACLGIDGTNEIRMYKDASTVASGLNIYISFTYFTDAA